MGLTLEIKNLDKVIAEIKAYPQDLEKIINAEFKSFGAVTVGEAQRLAPVDEGRLRQSINSKDENLKVTIGANVDYAAYIEFGTKGFAAAYVGTLPAEWQQFAAEFRGPGGGSFKELVMRITEWVHRKGLGSGFAGTLGIAGTYSVKTRKRTGTKKTQEQQDKQIAYLIARKILIKGIPAHPFLIPAFEHNKQKLIDNLKDKLPAK